MEFVKLVGVCIDNCVESVDLMLLSINCIEPNVPLVAVNEPVMFTFPVPVTFLLFKSRFPPSYGDVSCITSVIPPPLTVSNLIA